MISRVLVAFALFLPPVALAASPDDVRIATPPGDLLGQATASLATARALLDAAAVPPIAGEEFRAAARLARVAAEGEARRLAIEIPLVEPRALGPAEALRALVAASGASPSDADLAAFDALERSAPAAARAPLGRFLAAFLAFDEAARSKPAELGLVWSARLALLDAGVQLHEALADAPPSEDAGDPCARTTFGQAFSISLGPCDQTYARGDDYGLLLDAGGDDTYENNAGGNGDSDFSYGFTYARYANALFDFQGNDLYTTRAGAQYGFAGGSYGTGEGMLVDAAGSDSYDARKAVAAVGGAEALGRGFLLDAAGNDRYEGGGASIGGAYGERWFSGLPDDVDRQGTAHGFLLDGDGDDTYVATGGIAMTGGGYAQGVGFLFDARGDDVYLGGVAATNGGAARYGSLGRLVDATGNDTYGYDAAPASVSCWWGGANGGCGMNGGASNGGVALLVDGAGRDTYRARNYGVNGAVWGTGVGMLLDLGEGADVDIEDDAPPCIACVRPGTGVRGTLGLTLFGVLLVDVPMHVPHPTILLHPDRSLALYDDANGNGRADPGEVILEQASSAGVDGLPLPSPELADADGDGAPAALDLADSRLVVSFAPGEEGVRIEETGSATSVPLDPDDADPSDPNALHDADADGVPDAAEPTLCSLDNPFVASDGACDGPDYSPPTIADVLREIGSLLS